MKKIFYLVMVVVFTLLCSCSKKETASTEGSIVGLVSNDLKHELQRSKITLTDNAGKKETTDTGSDGLYEFQHLMLGQTYTIVAELSGYHSDTLTTKVDRMGVRGDFVLKEIALRLSATSMDASPSGEADFIIYNDSQRDMVWIINKNVDWLTVSKPSGTIPAKGAEPIHITINRAQVPSDTRKATIVVNSSHEYAELTVNITGEKAALNMVEITEVTASSAKFKGEITDSGSPVYTKRGFVYSTTSTPTIETTIKDLQVEKTENTDFFYTVSGLTLGQTYYVRAYAINSVGPAYSANEITFKPEMTYPTVTTQAVTNINIGSANVTLNGNIVYVGDPACTERGFVYDLYVNPTLDNMVQTVAGNGTGNFSINIQNLEAGVTYNVRAYATNAKGTVFGENVQFSIPAVSLPVVSILQTTKINSNGTNATFNAYVSAIGNPAGITKGFCYSHTNPNPTLDNGAHIDFSTTEGGNITTGNFSYTHTSLQPNQTYYLRSYVITPFDTVYSGISTFSTLTYVAMGDIGVQKQDTGSGLNWTTANNLCENSIVGGYTDWRLPTKEELITMYINRQIIGEFETVGHYWSSGTNNQGQHYSVNFSYTSDGGSVEANNDDGGYYTYFYCRCVRTLP
jgi:hypothetical protein